MKRILILISFGLAVLSLAIAYLCPSQFWQAFLINLSTSFLALGIGMIFVNIYLEQGARRGAVKSLLVLADRAISDFHNAWLNLCWTKFGRDQWGKIIYEYVDADSRPEALKQETRDGIYDLVKNNTSLLAKITTLEDSLVELARLVGWSLDARILGACLDARIAINKFKTTAHDDSNEAKTEITEHIIDTDIHTGVVRDLLMEIAGISE